MNLQKLSIGEFSRLCGVTVKTLRHYEKIGLLKAEQTDRALAHLERALASAISLL